MKVSLISLNLNGAPFLGDFLDSVHVEIAGDIDIELVLLDNGSSDNSVDMVLSEYPWVRLVQSSRNLGFAGGTQRAAEESDADILVFLNNDMILEPGFVDEILRPFECEENVGSVAGLILNETGTQVDYAGGDMNAFGWGFQRYHGEQVSVVDEEYFNSTPERGQPVRDVADATNFADRLSALPEGNSSKFPRQFFGCGGALAIKRNTWIESGGFDDDYFAFFEDVDLGWRLNVMGLKTLLAPKARVLHKHHGTAVAMPASLRTFLLERNSLMSVIKNYDDINLGKILPWAITMANERGLIDSSSHIAEIFRGRWADDVFASPDNQNRFDILKDLKNIKRTGLQKAKSILKKDAASTKYPIRTLAVEYVFLNWERLMIERNRVQNLRKTSDDEINDLMGERFRTVLGHQREKKLMETFKNYV